jgi:hypothetical protein
MSIIFNFKDFISKMGSIQVSQNLSKVVSFERRGPLQNNGKITRMEIHVEDSCARSTYCLFKPLKLLNHPLKNDVAIRRISPKKFSPLRNDETTFALFIGEN